MTNAELLALAKAANEAFLRDDPEVGEHMQRFQDARAMITAATPTAGK